MKILIYGAGVIGSIFAVKLHRSGQNVTMLARGRRLQELQQDGIVLCNPKTGKTQAARVPVIEHLLPEMEFDYILVVMQRVQVNSVLESLSKSRVKNIVFIVNTAAGYAQWEKALGTERLIIGFPSAGGERKDGVVGYFVGKGILRAFQTTTFGELSGEKTQRVTDLLKIFCRAGIPSVFCPDMDLWQKTHVAVVTEIANALYGHDCNNKSLAASRCDVKNMVLAVKEGFAVLRRLGIKPTPRKLSMLFGLPVSVLTAAFQLVMRTQLAEITMAKHCIAAKPEMIALQEEFDALIGESGLQTPHIEALRKNLLCAEGAKAVRREA